MDNVLWCYFPYRFFFLFNANWFITGCFTDDLQLILANTVPLQSLDFPKVRDLVTIFFMKTYKKKILLVLPKKLIHVQRKYCSQKISILWQTF